MWFKKEEKKEERLPTEAEIDAMVVESKGRMVEVYEANLARMELVVNEQRKAHKIYNEQKALYDGFQKSAEASLVEGRRDEARGFLQQGKEIEGVLLPLKETVESTDRAVTELTRGIEAQKAQITQIAVDALRLKKMIIPADIQERLTTALEGMSFQSHFQAFDEAHSIVRDFVAASDAEREVSLLVTEGARARSALDEAVTMDAAERELLELQARIERGEVSEVSERKPGILEEVDPALSDEILKSFGMPDGDLDDATRKAWEELNRDTGVRDIFS